MYIIDETYFNQDIFIPKASGDLDFPGANFLEGWIDKYARLLLQRALGEHFLELDSDIENGNLKESAPDKLKNLVNGITYSYEGKSFVWKGLLVKEGAHKESVLATYVYYHWYLNAISSTTNAGEVDNGMINPHTKLIQVWNKFVDQYQAFKTYAQGTLTYLKGVPFYDYYSGGSNVVSLIQYLEHQKADFPNASKILEEHQNFLGL